MHLQQPVHFLHRHAGAVGDADLAPRVQQVRLGPLLRRHRQDDRFQPRDGFVVHLAGRHGFLRLGHARQHLRQRAQATHLLHLAELRQHVGHVELALGKLGRHRLGLGDIQRFRRPFHQADDIAHAQDAPGRPLGVEGLQRVDLLAGADELDRLAGDEAHRQRRATARIAVHPGQHHAGQRHFAAEILGHIHGVLPGQRIDDQQRLGGTGCLRDRLHFGHQRLVDMQPPGSVQHQHVKALQLRRLQRALRDINRLLPGDDRQRRHANLLAQHLQLVLRGRAIDVEGRHHHLLAALVFQQLGQLGRRRRLARALQTHHHHDGGRRHIQLDVGILAAQRLHQAVVHDLHDLLAGRHRLQHFHADRTLGRPVDEVLHHRQRYIGLQ